MQGVRGPAVRRRPNALAGSSMLFYHGFGNTGDEDDCLRAEKRGEPAHVRWTGSCAVAAKARRYVGTAYRFVCLSDIPIPG